MESERKPRERLIAAAATLLASDGPAVSTRAICEAAGVTAPTLYHYFGDRDGLVDAVISDGFGKYLASKRALESTGDPLEDLRRGWDDHIAWGTANPTFYVLMYGRAVRPPAAAEASALLLLKLEAAARAGLLIVSPELAARMVMSSNTGLTLQLIASGGFDASLSARVRESTFAGIMRTHPVAHDAASAAIALKASLAADVLSPAERPLLDSWLDRIAAS
jgi:AcrR family transcriptional regulator